MYSQAPYPPAQQPPAGAAAPEEQAQQYQQTQQHQVPSLQPEYATSTKPEPYGAVPMTTAAATTATTTTTPTNVSSTSGVTQRRSFQSPATRRASPYVLQQPEYTRSGSGLSSSMSSAGGIQSSNNKKGSYASFVGGYSDTNDSSTNTLMSIVLGIPLALVLWNHATPVPLQTFLFTTLVVYALDLCRLQDWTLAAVWVGGGVILPATNLFLTILGDEGSDGNEGGIGLLYSLLRVFVESLLFLCVACWGSLQLRWMHKESKALAVMLARILHTGAVPVSACMLTYHTIQSVQHRFGMDTASTMAPHLFASLLTIAMLTVGSVKTTTGSSSNNNSEPSYLVSSVGAKLHATLLLLLPGSMHVLMFRNRILSSYASYDEWCDVALVWTVPYLLLYTIQTMHHNNTRPGPYELRFLFGPSANATLRGALVPVCVSLVASLALEEKYLIPLCQQAAYPFVGHELPHKTTVGLLLTAGIVLALFALWVNGRRSSVTNEPLFGAYHDDVVQLSLAVTGLTIGRAVGMPWTLTPLPILAFLGLIIWSSTRMLRYLCILLFVIHSTGVVLFSYRYAGLGTTIPLAIPNVSLNLFRFGMFLTIVSLAIFLVMGLAVRSSGGMGAKLLRAYDGAGFLLALYALSLTVAECTLLNMPMPYQDLAGIEMMAHETGSGLETHEDFAYGPQLAYTTSIMLAAVALFLMKYRHISTFHAVFVVSWAMGKAVAVFVDSNDQNHKASHKPDHAADAMALLIRCCSAGLTLAVMFGPRVVLSPVHLKASAASWKRSYGKPSRGTSLLPAGSGRTIMLYALLILPLALATAVPIVLQPLMGILSGRSGGGGVYHSLRPPASEVFGLAATLWGLSMMSMLNHYLPDGGGDSWKKATALVFLMGIGLMVSAPTLPDWFFHRHKGKASVRSTINPYALLSSLGADLAKTGRSSAGGWGLVAAAFATLLAITGPLELRERSGGRDDYHLARVMVFSLLFGCGVAWFVTLQSMSEEAFLPLFVTTAACMVMSFFGTVAAVIGNCLELDAMDEAIQVAQVWAVAFPIFAATSAMSELVDNGTHLFGVGGWLSTYLVVCSSVTLGYTTVMRSRLTKSPATRGISNLSCIVSWVCAMVVLYGRYGVAGLDASLSVTSVVGIPAPVLGTFVLSLLLLGLEGESSSHGGNNTRRGRAARIVGKPKPPVTSKFGITFQSLNRSNSFVPLVLSIAGTFLLASIYAILIRGCGILEVATDHKQLYDAIYQSNSGADQDLATLAQQNIVHSKALLTSARLAASSFWTAPTLNGPLLQLGGLLATMPSLYGLLWQQQTNGSLLLLTVPINLVPLLFCRAVPSTQALAGLCLLAGAGRLSSMQNRNKRGKMRI